MRLFVRSINVIIIFAALPFNVSVYFYLFLFVARLHSLTDFSIVSLRFLRLASKREMQSDKKKGPREKRDREKQRKEKKNGCTQKETRNK